MKSDPAKGAAWTTAKWLCYAGGVAVAVCAAMVGFLHVEPPEWLWSLAVVSVGLGVIIGNVVAYRARTSG